jgi:hypothetical protein
MVQALVFKMEEDIVHEPYRKKKTIFHVTCIKHLNPSYLNVQRRVLHLWGLHGSQFKRRLFT